MGKFKPKTTTSSTNTLQPFIANQLARPRCGVRSCCSHAGLRPQKFHPAPLHSPPPPPPSFPGSVSELCYLSPNFQRDLCRRRLTAAIALTSARRAPAVRPRRYHVRSLLNYNYETTNPLIVPPYGLRLDTCHHHMSGVISQEAVCALLASMATEPRDQKVCVWGGVTPTGTPQRDDWIRKTSKFMFMDVEKHFFFICDAIIIIIFGEAISQTLFAVRRGADKCQRCEVRTVTADILTCYNK